MGKGITLLLLCKGRAEPPSLSVSLFHESKMAAKLMIVWVNAFISHLNKTSRMLKMYISLGFIFWFLSGHNTVLMLWLGLCATTTWLESGKHHGVATNICFGCHKNIWICPHISCMLVITPVLSPQRPDANKYLMCIWYATSGCVWLLGKYHVLA